MAHLIYTQLYFTVEPDQLQVPDSMRRFVNMGYTNTILLIVWLIVGLLAGWLTGWLAGLLVGWLVDWVDWSLWLVKHC